MSQNQAYLYVKSEYLRNGKKDILNNFGKLVFANYTNYIIFINNTNLIGKVIFCRIYREIELSGNINRVSLNVYANRKFWHGITEYGFCNA